MHHYSGKPGYGDLRKQVFRFLVFPLEFLFLEGLLHLYMGAPLKYAPIWVLFALAAGLFFSALTMFFPRKVNMVLFCIFAAIFPLIYIVEMIAKTILQTYYPVSFLQTAAGNRLTDYMDIIIPTVLSFLPVILVCYALVIAVIVLGIRNADFEQQEPRIAIFMVAGIVVLHLAGLGAVHFPWGGDLPPAQLYNMDSGIDDQVEQLGMWTMLRLDVKHMFIRPSTSASGDFSGLDTLSGDGSGSGSSSGSGSGSSSAAGSASEPDPEPVIDTSPNIMDVDLAALAEQAPNDDIKWLCEYFDSVTPTKKNEYTGMFEGYNVVFFTLEGFSGYAIDPELTPTLYKLTHEGFVFNNFYTALHFTSTSGGECQNLLGLYPKNGNPATLPHTGDLKTSLPFTLAHQLANKGYLVQGYHPNSNMYNRELSHPNLGYDWHQFGMNFDNLEVSDSGKLLWPQRDSYMIEASVDNYINSTEPFHIYYLTISGHMPYVDNRVVAPYRETVRALPYSETTQDYIGTAMEVDKCLQTLIDKLEAAGKLDNTLIVAVPDHIPYFNADVLEELTGETFGSSDDLEYLKESAINFEVYHNSLIMWSASMEEPVEVNKVCCQVDILPTLSNLLGLEYDSRMMDGTDMLSDSEGLVVFNSRCWKSDRGFYNRFEQTFTPAEGVTMTEEEQETYVSAMKKLVGYKLDSTNLLVENNFYNYVFGGGG